MSGVAIFSIVVPFLLLLHGAVADAIPSWAKSETQVRNGNTFTVVCNGAGPAVDLARATALQSCRSSALTQLQTAAKVKSVTVETESDVALHSEVSETLTYKGLTCIPEKESIEQTDASATVWLKCRFDLSKAYVIQTDDTDEASQQTVTTGQVSNKDSAESVSEKNVSSDNQQRVVSSDHKVLSISSVPQCTTLIIRGANPRIVNCKENPMSIVLMKGDKTIIVRADKYQPKTLDLQESGENYETISVILDQ